MNFCWALGIVDLALAIGEWAQPPIPNPQSPIPNPQSPNTQILFFNILKIMNKNLIFKFKKINKIYKIKDINNLK